MTILLRDVIGEMSLPGGLPFHAVKSLPLKPSCYLNYSLRIGLRQASGLDPAPAGAPLHAI
jgi:hypothetical protein